MNSPGRAAAVGRPLAFIALLSLAAAAPAAVPARPDGYVTDEAGVINPRTEQALEGLMGDLDRKTGVQVAVVTARSLDGRDVAEASAALYSDWGIGKKGKDEGVLFLIAPSDRRARIEVGYGLEGLIPDARAGRILDEKAMARFRAGDMEGGIVAAAVEVVSIVAADRKVQVGVPRGTEPPRKEAPLWLVLLMAAVFGYLLIRHPWLLLLFMSGGGRGGGWGGGGGFGGFGGFGGGRSGGGGASRGW